MTTVRHIGLVFYILGRALDFRLPLYYNISNTIED